MCSQATSYTLSSQITVNLRRDVFQAIIEGKTKIKAEDGKQELVITRNEMFPSMLLLILTVVSWYFRPADRNIVSVGQ